MNSDLRFQELVGILSRRKRLVFMVTASGMFLAGAGALLMPPHYTAKAQVILDPQQVGHVGESTLVVNQAAETFLIPTQVTMLLSHDQVERVRSSLATDPAFQAAEAAWATNPPALGAAWGKPLADAWDALAAWLPDSWQWAGVAAKTPEEPQRHVVAPMGSRHWAAPRQQEFERQLKVFQEPGSHVIAVTYAAGNPGTAAAIANKVVQLYIESQNEQKRVDTSRELAWFAERIPVVKAKIEQAERAVEKYHGSHGLTEVNSAAANEQQAADLGRQLVASEADFAARQARLSYVRGLRGHGSDTGTFLEALNSPTLAELHRQESALLQQEAELAPAFGASHPKPLQVHSQLQDIRAKFSQEIDRAVRNLDNEAQIAGTLVAGLRMRLAAVNGAMGDMRLRDLEHDVAATRQTYNGLIQRQEEVRGQQDTLHPDARILSHATAPERPSSPNPLLFLLPAMIVFLIAGSMLAVLLERLDRKLRSQDDVHEALGIRCIALVPQLRRIGRIRPHQYLLAKPLTAYTEAIRSVVAALQLAAPYRAPKVVLISSSVPGEGKTTLAVSLAAYMASLGRRVLLVDLDFRHSTILRELGGNADVGILDVIAHDRPLAEAIQHLPEMGLDYLPVCQRPADPFALFASHQMSRLLGTLREKYDCVIVDSPPLLAITEVRLLATMVDKVLFVVKWGSTRRDLARSAVGLLRGRDVPGGAKDDLASVVMTQVNLKKHARSRYGDVAEASVRYKKYYIEG